MDVTQTQLTRLLPNDVLSRVERMRLNPNRRFTVRSRGEHLTGKGGQSTEFSDYRDYTAGDDIRYVDWNIFSRLQRPYLKLFHHEEELHVVILIDASTSMNFEGKLDRAKQLGAALGVMGLFNQEKVSVCAFSDGRGPIARLPACSGRGSLRKLFGFIEPIEAGGPLPLEKGVEQMMRDHRGRGVCIVLSDFLTYSDPGAAFTRLFSAGLEVFAIQILGPTEIDPELGGDIRFVDSEGAGTLDVTAGGDVLAIYHEYRQRYENHLAAMCKQRGGRFLSLSSQMPLEKVLFDELRRKGWVR